MRVEKPKPETMESQNMTPCDESNTKDQSAFAAGCMPGYEVRDLKPGDRFYDGGTGSSRYKSSNGESKN